MRVWSRFSLRGFGLIELLIALTLGLVMVMGVIQVFIASKQSFVLQRAAGDLYEDARYLSGRLGQEIRMVNMFGCLDLARLPADIRTSIPAAFNDPIRYTVGSGVGILTLVTAVPNFERFTARASRSPSDYGARWLIVTNCRDTLDFRISATGPLAVRPGDVVIPIRQMEYRFSKNAIQVRNNGAGNFQTLIDGVADLVISFGLAASPSGREVSGTYVNFLAASDAARIRSVNLQWQLSDNPATPASGNIKAQNFKQVVAIRNRLE
jgi:type IV pilus assembly protein PilW